MTYLSESELSRLLALPNYIESNHVIGLLVQHVSTALASHYQLPVQYLYGQPIVDVHDNYTALGYDTNEVTLSSIYTKYVSQQSMLRTQMTSVIPPLLTSLSTVNSPQLYCAPGRVYRRDVRDKTHVGEPHQMDVWMLSPYQQTRHDLLTLVTVIVQSLEKVLRQPIEWRYTETSHHYTDDGIEVEILHQGQWMEILECGLAGRTLLDSHGHTNLHGLALGLGLERLAMIVKELPDIRLLYSEHPKIQSQMYDLTRYKPISRQPSTTRDMSIIVPEDTTIETLTECILSHAYHHEWIESMTIVSETPHDALPTIAQQRLGSRPGMKNVLLRITLQDLTSSIVKAEANAWYNHVYAGIHQGDVGYYI